MLKVFFIAAGGAAGAVLRYWMSGLSFRFLPAVFPYGTLIVNLLGSLVVGFLWGVSEVVIIPQNIRLMVFIGVLGSFTTFSTFSLENFHLLRDGEYAFFVLNIVLSVVLGLILVFVGYFLSRYVFQVMRWG